MSLISGIEQEEGCDGTMNYREHLSVLATWLHTHIGEAEKAEGEQK